MSRIDKYHHKRIIGWKKAYARLKPRSKKLVQVLIKLEIPATADRLQPEDYKCRASEAKVLEIITLPNKCPYDKKWEDDYNQWHKVNQTTKGGKKLKAAMSSWDRYFKYRKGSTVKPRSPFNTCYIECASGIHFFLTKTEARKYDFG